MTRHLTQTVKGTITTFLYTINEVKRNNSSLVVLFVLCLGGSFCLMCWCLKFFVLFDPNVCFHIFS